MTVREATKALLEACKEQNLKDINAGMKPESKRTMFTWQLCHDLASVLLMLDEIGL